MNDTACSLLRKKYYIVVGWYTCTCNDNSIITHCMTVLDQILIDQAPCSGSILYTCIRSICFVWPLDCVQFESGFIQYCSTPFLMNEFRVSFYMTVFHFHSCQLSLSSRVKYARKWITLHTICTVCGNSPLKSCKRFELVNCNISEGGRSWILARQGQFWMCSMKAMKEQHSYRRLSYSSAQWSGFFLGKK